MTTKQQRAMQRAGEISKTGSGYDLAVFRLRDYLSPGGKYPYDDLAPDLESAFSAGYVVYLFDVPGNMMVTGYPLEEDDDDYRPWANMDCRDMYYGTAKEALKGYKE